MRLTQYDIVEPAMRETILRKLSTKVRCLALPGRLLVDGCSLEGCHIYIQQIMCVLVLSAAYTFDDRRRHLCLLALRPASQKHGGCDGQHCSTREGLGLYRVEREGFDTLCSCLSRNTECDSLCACQASSEWRGVVVVEEGREAGGWVPASVLATRWRAVCTNGCDVCAGRHRRLPVCLPAVPPCCVRCRCANMPQAAAA